RCGVTDTLRFQSCPSRRSPDLRAPPSFPTRRSSDLNVHTRFLPATWPETIRQRAAGRAQLFPPCGSAGVTYPLLLQRDIEFILRSEEHTSELQSREKLVCRLLLEKKNA